MAHAGILAASAARSQGVAREWQSSATVRHLRDTLDAAGEDAERLAAAAEALLRDAAWVAAMLSPLVAALANDPWFEPPLRVSRDALRTGAILFDHRHVAITASVTSAATLRRQPRAVSVVAAGRLSVVRYFRGGGATLRRWRVEEAGCRPLPGIALSDGAILRSDGRTTATLIEDAVSDVVAVTATIRVGAATLMREFDRDSGAPTRLTALDDGSSRGQLLLGLLRLASPSQVAPGFDAATRDPAFFLRWEAMREWLSRDVRAATPRLVEMAQRDPHPEVRAAARATLPLATRHAA